MWQHSSGLVSQRRSGASIGRNEASSSPYRSTSRSRVSYVSGKSTIVSSSTMSTSSPSSEIMWMSTELCRCHEHVRQSRSPNSSAAHRRTSSADMASKFKSGSRAVATEEHLLQRVGTQAEPQRLERDDLLGRDVPEVHARSELPDEPGLGALRGRLEDQVVDRDLVRDLVDEAGAHLAGRAVDAGGAAFPPLRDHLPGASLELLLDPLDPQVRRDVHVRVLRADLGEHREVAREVGDQLELALARQVDDAVRDLDVREPEVGQPALVLVDLALRDHGLEERPADHDRLALQDL